MSKDENRWYYWIMGVILLLIAGLSTYMVVGNLTSWATASGQVMDVVERTVTDEGTGEAQTLLFPVVVFTTHEGKKQVVELDQGEVESSYAMGDEITVHYDLRDPQIAGLENGGELPLLWMLSAGCASVGLVYVGFQIKKPD